jgi:uncharacterized membrane protein YfcA
MQTYVIFATILSLAMFVQSSVGFGGAMVAVPLLSLFLDPRDTIPVLALVEILVNFWLVVQARKSISWKTVGWFLLGAIPACYAGVHVLAHMPIGMIRALICVVTLVFALLFLFKVTVHIPNKPFFKTLIGIVSGFLGGSSSISGPPVVLYGVTQKWEKDVFRATLISYFLFLALSTGAFSIFQGLLAEKGIKLFAAGVIPALVASWLGVLVKTKLSEDFFRKAVLATIVTVSVVGLATIRL